MSYIVNDGPDPGRSRRQLLLAGAAVLVVVLVLAGFFLGRSNGGSGGGEGGPSLGLEEPVVTWSRVGDQPVPSSRLHGPTETGNGLAAGFSHDELGAVLAAINISTRLTSAAGPLVYETTARQQCIGDITAAISAIRSQRSSAAAGSTTATEYFYRVTAGDPDGDLVVVSIAASSAQTATMGGFAEFSRTLQWIDNDWKLQIPVSPPRLVTSIAGYTSLGRPDAS